MCIAIGGSFGEIVRIVREVGWRGGARCGRKRGVDGGGWCDGIFGWCLWLEGGMVEVMGSLLESDAGKFSVLFTREKTAQRTFR